MTPQQEFQRSRLSLSVFVQAVFNEAKVLDARDWKIQAGISRYFTQPQVPFGIKDVARAKRLNVTARYALLLQERVAATADSKGEVTSFQFPRTIEEANEGKVKVVPCFYTRRRADLVWDDADELAACDFHFPAVAEKLTRGTRAKVYGKTLFDVKPPADDNNSGFFDNGSLFYATAATQGTYLSVDDGATYYAKWLEPKPEKPEQRKYHFDKLSDEYIVRNYKAYDLEKNAVHLFIQVGEVSLVAKLYWNDKRQLSYDAIYGQGLPSYGNYFQLLNDHMKALKAKNPKVQGAAWFVYSLEGTDKPPVIVSDGLPAGNLSLNMMEQVVDPQIVVRSMAGTTLAQLDPLQRKFDSRMWLKEMVRLKFSEPWVWFWKNADIQMFYEIDREKLFLRDLRAQEAKAVGPLKQTLRKFIKAAEDDPQMHMVRRGYKYGDKRVIGSDDSYVYLYNNKQRLVTRLPMFSFWRDANVSQISGVIYENTKGMIPISKAICWAGVAVMGWAVVGTEVLVMGARNYVRKRIANFALDKVLEESFKRFRHWLLMRLLLPALELFGVASAVSALGGEKVYKFLKGFLEGFTEHAFSAMMDRWVSLLNLEPAAYRAIKLAMKIEGILRWVDEKMSALKEYVNDKVAGLLANRFVSVAVDAGSGFLTVVSNLYFLDYERAKGILEIYAELSGEPMPTKAQWDKVRHKQMVETIHQWEVRIKDEARDLKDLYDDVQGAVNAAKWVARGAVVLIVADVATAGGLVPMVVIAFRNVAKGVVSVATSKPGKVVVGGVVVMSILDDDFRKEVVEFLKDFGDATATLATPLKFAWGNSARMQRFGQLLGIIVASFVVSRAVLKEGKWKDRWAASGKSYPKFVGKNFIKSQININPIYPAIKLAVFHYVHMVEKVFIESKQSFVELEEKIENILLGDPAYRDIIEPDEGLSLPKLLQVLQEVDKLITVWLARLSKIPGLSDQISAMGAKIKGLAPDKMPTIDDVRDGKLDELGFVREAFMFIALSHLQGGLNMLAHSIKTATEPVNPKDPAPVSVADVLQMLGCNLTDEESDALLDKNFELDFKEE